VNVICLLNRLPEKVPLASTVCAGTGREK